MSPPEIPAGDQDFWLGRAACVGYPPETFFPIGDNAPASQVARAKAVCAQCPVRQACLDWAVTALPYGIAGGLTGDERRQMRREQDGHVEAAS